MSAVPGLRSMCRCLMVLEHSCFACAENEAHLVEMEVTHGLPPVVNCVLLIQWLVQQVQVLNRQAFVPGLKKVRGPSS